MYSCLKNIDVPTEELFTTVVVSNNKQPKVVLRTFSSTNDIFKLQFSCEQPRS